MGILTERYGVYCRDCDRWIDAQTRSHWHEGPRQDGYGHAGLCCDCFDASCGKPSSMNDNGWGSNVPDAPGTWYLVLPSWVFPDDMDTVFENANNNENCHAARMVNGTATLGMTTAEGLARRNAASGGRYRVYKVTEVSTFKEK